MHIEIPAWLVPYAQALGVVAGMAGAFLHGFFTPSPRERALEAALSALKGARTMPTLFDVIPAAIELTKDGEEVVQGLQSDNKDEFVKAALDAAPAIAKLINQPELPSLLTAAGLGVAFDVAEGTPKLVAAVVACLEHRAAKQAAPTA